MATRLFVGNLPDNTDEADLHAAFSTYGEITNLDLKSKSSNESKEPKKFAFVTLSGSNYNIESCIKHFTSEEFNGARLYVTRARESFLERLQRERQQTQKKDTFKEHETPPQINPVIKLGDKLNPRKRKIIDKTDEKPHKENKTNTIYNTKSNKDIYAQNGEVSNQEANMVEKDKKKYDSEQKRLESMKKKRQEFREKKMIIKNGLTAVDKIPNKKVIFSDNEEADEPISKEYNITQKQSNNKLFDDEDSEDEVNFEIKKQYEGKMGQKVLDLQSRYKSDKRFVLDERFVEDDPNEIQEVEKENDEEVEISQKDEKTKQLNILQDVLGVAIKTNSSRSSNKDVDGKKSKPKLGMLRFDPSHPEHAKFLVPKEVEPETSKKNKKKLKDKNIEKNEDPQPVVEKVEVSQEQFYKVSETLKDAIAKPNTFSLRSLFAPAHENETGTQEQVTDYIPLEKPKQQKVKNPLNPSEKNPFVYDSSDSENEEEKPEVKIDQPTVEPKAVWKENLFFSKNDTRLKEGLAFFNKSGATEVHKERRELKSLVKKRIYNNERKNQMFQKKIGGRKKTMKKNFRKKN